MNNPSLTPEVRQQLLSATKEAAVAFLQDMEHIREIANKGAPNSAELRRVSGTLRRLLVDHGGDIRKLAPPRVGPISLRTLDNSEYYTLSHKFPYALFISGKLGPPFDCRGITQHRPHQPAFKHPAVKENIFIDVSLDGFLSNKILCINTSWLTRRDTIKYIANTACGVHSGRHQDKQDIDFLRLRGCASFSVEGNGMSHTRINLEAHLLAQPDFVFKPNEVDPVLNELYITCYLLTISPDISKLEEAIKSELGA